MFTYRYILCSAASKAVEGDSELHHDPFVLHTIVLDMSAWVLMHVEGIHDAERQFVRLTLPSEATGLLDRDDLASGVELVQEEDEELIEELADACSVPSLSDVLFLDHIEVVFKESISLDHAEDARVGIATLAVTIVASSALLALKLFYRDWVVDRLGLLRAELAFL